MPALELLQRKLRNLNLAALARMRLGDSLQMLNERAKLQQWVSGTVHLEEATSNTIEAALRAFAERQYLKGVRQIRLVCYGCTQVFGNSQLRLIESREFFGKLLQAVEGYANRKRPLRKFYRGLLSSFFSYDPQAPGATLNGRENHEVLRKFLDKHLDDVLAGGHLPDWLAMLGQHRNLLGEQPCQAYGAAALQGDWTVFDEVRERLEISAESWLVREMVLTPVRAVVGMDDHGFKDNLDSILLLLNKYPLYAATGLQLVLDRYAQCAEREVSDTLRDYAVGLWGNPWLPENSHQWQCGKAAGEMLAHWLKRHLLGEFFSLLCNDDSSHPRRLDFWDTYSESLTGMYFALGKDAFAAGSLPLHKFRHLAKGLIAKLAEEKQDVHACIMQFRHFHVVEFNRDTGAAYFYDTRHGTPPFYLSKGWVEIGALNVAKVSQGVDVSRLSKAMQHQDTAQLAWEGRFAQELGTSESLIQSFCRKYRCSYEDRRPQDGCQWIRPENRDQYGQEVWAVLQGWGFSFLPEQSAYFRQVAATGAN